VRPRERVQDNVLQTFPRCGYAPLWMRSGATDDPAFNGWVESVQQQIPSGATTFNYLAAGVTVPPAPINGDGSGCQVTSSCKLLYYFNGLGPQNTSAEILQPVLQYGWGTAGGGNWWGIASWEVFGPGSGQNGSSIHTSLAEVGAGATLALQIFLHSTQSHCIGSACGYSSVCGTGYTYGISISQLGPQVVTYGPARDRKRACRTACSANGPTTAYTPCLIRNAAQVGRASVLADVEPELRELDRHVRL
jgi:hypothetical protein